MMKFKIAILFLGILMGLGCEESGERDIHGRPVEYLPAGEARIVVSEITTGRIHLNVFLSGSAINWSYVGLCYLKDGDLGQELPKWEENTLSPDAIKYGKNEYDFNIKYYSPSSKRFTVRVFFRSNDFRIAYGDCLTVTPGQGGGGTLVLPAAPKCTIAEDLGHVTLVSSLSGAVSGLKARGFCLTAPKVKPDQYTLKIVATGAGATFSATVDTLRRGVLYAVWAYLEDDSGLRFGDSTQIRIPAPELAPSVLTLDGAAVYYEQLTARGKLTDDRGGKVEQAGIQWGRLAADLDDDPGVAYASAVEADGRFSAFYNVAGTWYYRAFVTTAYGTGYGEILTVEVADFKQYLPVVTTDEKPVKHTASTVTVSGRVDLNGGPKITERGFCAHVFSDPKSYDSPVKVNGTTGTMMAVIEEVPMDRTYYYRAYAKNAAGTAYGPVRSVYIRSSDYEVVFRDLEATVNSDGSVTFGVDVWNDRGQKFRERGFCWDDSAYSTPTISDEKQKTGSSYGSGYDVKVDSYRFREGNQYRVRAYVVTDDGVVWYSDKYEKVVFTIPDGE